MTRERTHVIILPGETTPLFKLQEKATPGLPLTAETTFFVLVHSKKFCLVPAIERHNYSGSGVRRNKVQPYQ